MTVLIRSRAVVPECVHQARAQVSKSILTKTKRPSVNVGQVADRPVSFVGLCFGGRATCAVTRARRFDVDLDQRSHLLPSTWTLVLGPDACSVSIVVL